MKLCASLMRAFILAIFSCTCIVAFPVSQSNPHRKTVDLGEINKQALRIPLVDYPPAARAAGIYGIVKVRVWIDKKGEVIRGGGGCRAQATASGNSSVRQGSKISSEYW